MAEIPSAELVVTRHTKALGESPRPLWPRLTEASASELWTLWRLAGAALLVRAWDAMVRRFEVVKQRNDLRSLSQEYLRDIGLTVDEVRSEIEKPFWQD